MSLAKLKIIHGRITLENKRPDGDSIRFKPDSATAFEDLYRAYRIEPGKDGSVQLRLEGIDAPETHYGSEAQPLGNAARDKLLQLAGFKSVKLAADGATVESSKPASVGAQILTEGADPHGRPIAFLLIGKAAHEDGSIIEVDAEILRQSVNYKMLAAGLAYPLFYLSMAASHRRVFQAAARSARSAGSGVWAVDQTREFKLRSQSDIGREGALIYPKLFRRGTDYLREVGEARVGASFKHWLETNPEENDAVVIQGLEVPLSSLVYSANSRVKFQADVTELVFVEK